MMHEQQLLCALGQIVNRKRPAGDADERRNRIIRGLLGLSGVQMWRFYSHLGREYLHTWVLHMQLLYEKRSALLKPKSPCQKSDNQRNVPRESAASFRFASWSLSVDWSSSVLHIL